MSHSEVAADVHEDKEHEEPDVAVQEKVSDGASLDSPVESARLLDCSRPRSSSEAGIPSAVLQGRIRSTSFNEQGTHSPLRMRQAPARRVLLAIDGSQGSKNAFDWYIENLYRPTDLALLVHVYGQPSLPAISFSLTKFKFNIPYEVWQERLQEAIDKAHKTVNHYEAVFQSKKIRHQTLVMSGSAGELICQAAKEHHADMIVMGSRGLNAIRRSFLGSVSSYTLDHTHIPVIVVPTQK